MWKIIYIAFANVSLARVASWRQQVAEVYYIYRQNEVKMDDLHVPITLTSQNLKSKAIAYSDLQTSYQNFSTRMTSRISSQIWSTQKTEVTEKNTNMQYRSMKTQKIKSSIVL